MRAYLTELAQEDLDSLSSWIAQDDETAAIGQVLRALDAVESLCEFPNLGRGGRVPGTRELAIGGTPYIVVYRVRSNALWALRVLHCARRWPTR